MAKKFDIYFEHKGLTVTAELLEDKAPITCENFWNGISRPCKEKIHHGGETGPELWCFVQPPAEELPFEHSEVFPVSGDILYYHYIQPPTRDGVRVFDIGIYYNRGCSKLKQGWMPGNLFARVLDPDDIAKLKIVASDLLAGKEIDVVLKRQEA